MNLHNIAPPEEIRLKKIIEKLIKDGYYTHDQIRIGALKGKPRIQTKIGWPTGWKWMPLHDTAYWMKVFKL